VSNIRKAEGPAAWAINKFSEELVEELRNRLDTVRQGYRQSMNASNTDAALALLAVDITLAHVIDAIKDAAKRSV
jgi:hypothetical protein